MKITLYFLSAIITVAIIIDILSVIVWWKVLVLAFLAYGLYIDIRTLRRCIDERLKDVEDIK